MNGKQAREARRSERQALKATRDRLVFERLSEVLEIVNRGFVGRLRWLLFGK
ncbi:MAG: hypothetical protein KBA95_01770 [Acidobacteria bacterium]|nr:hypothetical protein [Acidobacteriota bacterium]